MKLNKSLILWITSAIISTIMINLGIKIINQNKYTALITILTALVLLYITYYAYQIKANEDDVKEIKEWIETNGEVLNTIKDIVILKKIGKIK